MAESADFTRSKYLEGLKRLARTVNAKTQQHKSSFITNLHPNQPDQMLVEVVYSFVPAHTSSYFPLTVDSDGNPIAPPGTASQQGYGKVFIDGGNHTVTYMTPPTGGDGPFVFPYNSCVIKTMGLPPPPTDPLDPTIMNGVATGGAPIYTAGVRYSSSYASPQGGEVPLPGDVVYVQRNGRDLMILSAINTATNHFQQTWSLPGLLPASYARGGWHPVEAEHETRINYVCATLGTLDATTPTSTPPNFGMLPVTAGCWLTDGTSYAEFTQIAVPCQAIYAGNHSYKRGDCVTYVVGTTPFTLLCVKPGISGTGPGTIGPNSGPPATIGQFCWDGVLPYVASAPPYPDPDPSPLVCWQVVPRNFTSQSFYDNTTTPPCGQFTDHAMYHSVATNFGHGLQVSLDSYTGSTAADLVVRMKGQ